MATGDPQRTTPVEPQRAGPLRATRHPQVELPDQLPARMLNEFVYCPRLFFYEWVEGLFAHSADTVEGSLRHEKLRARGIAAVFRARRIRVPPRGSNYKLNFSPARAV